MWPWPWPRAWSGSALLPSCPRPSRRDLGVAQEPRCVWGGLWVGSGSGRQSRLFLPTYARSGQGKLSLTLWCSPLPALPQAAQRSTLPREGPGGGPPCLAWPGRRSVSHGAVSSRSARPSAPGRVGPGQEGPAFCRPCSGLSALPTLSQTGVHPPRFTAFPQEPEAAGVGAEESWLWQVPRHGSRGQGKGPPLRGWGHSSPYATSLSGLVLFVPPPPGTHILPAASPRLSSVLLPALTRPFPAWLHDSLSACPHSPPRLLVARSPRPFSLACYSLLTV